MKLRYHDPLLASKNGYTYLTPASYTGNITEMEWKQGTGIAQMYAFKYDRLSRLTETDQFAFSGTKWAVAAVQYVENGISYDKNGNLLKKNSHADKLTYSYTGNQLTTLTDGAKPPQTYDYDSNGNMKKDSRKGLTFNYNSLNLVQNVKDISGAVKAKYAYTADGSKHSVKDASEANGYDYTGSLIYSTNNGVRTLESASFGGGVIKGNGEVNYFVTDHLGSIRVIVNASNGQVIERNDYTAFGVRHPNPNLVISTNRFKFNGKEDQTTGSLALLDYGARMYDPVTGKLNGFDPLAEIDHSVSPYAYCRNNPVKFIDPDGKDIVITGALSDDALKQLQAKVGNHMTLSMNENGKVSYTLAEGQKLKGDSKQLAGIIDNSSITVNVLTTSETETSTGNLMIGGAFMGNTVTKDANGNVTVSANQEVNPNVLGSADAHTKTPGKMMMHEITESYEGAKISQKSGTSSPRAGIEGSIYESAHNRATGQSIVARRMFDAQGKEVFDASKAVRIEWSVSKGAKEKIIQTLK